MNTADIKVGAEYAASRYKGARADRVVVLAVKHPRKYTPEGGYRQEVKNNGVLVKRADGKGDEFILLPKDIIGDWDAYATEWNANVKAAADSRESALQRHRDQIARINASVPDGTRLPYWASGKEYGDSTFSSHGDMWVYELATLLEAAYEHGKASA